MPHGGIIEAQHSDVVLDGFEAKLRLLEKWLEEPRSYPRVERRWIWDRVPSSMWWHRILDTVYLVEGKGKCINNQNVC